MEGDEIMNKIVTKFNIVGSAFGHGAQIYTTHKSPDYLRYMYNLINKLGDRFHWYSTIGNENILEEREIELKGYNYNAVVTHNTKLANTVSNLVLKNNEFCIIIGGDHSCGIGTWSGIIKGLNAKDNFGLIWIDAHMDAHTYETSPSKCYHGMPLAVLLGKGDEVLCKIGLHGRKIKPTNLVLIGIRSFEDGEKKLLEENGVKIFYMDDVRSLGIQRVFEEALQIITNNTQEGFGVSIDLDAFDPEDTPGVGSPEPDGLNFEETSQYLPLLFSSEYLKCLEIVEFNPEIDKEDKTANVLHKILSILDNTVS